MSLPRQACDAVLDACKDDFGRLTQTVVHACLPYFLGNRLRRLIERHGAGGQQAGARHDDQPCHTRLHSHITPGTAAAGKDVVILERSRWRVGSHMEME